MKQLTLILLIFVCLNAGAQNWQSIAPADTLYYRVHATGIDSEWNHYVRCIYIDSATPIPNGVKNSFYPSIRLNKFDLIDTANGGTWLGKYNVRYANGDEYFFNQYEDSIMVKTQAALSDAWILCQVNGTEYHATVSALAQTQIDGVTDSIKTISLQAMQNGLPIASIYNSLPLVLSKAHGLYCCFELFGFPQKTAATFDPQISYPFPYLPFVHQRLDSAVVKHMNYSEDFLWKYKPGNEWIRYWEHNTWTDWGYIHDSIIGSQMIGPDAMEVTRYRHTYANVKIFPQQQNPYDTAYHIFQTFTDTVTQGAAGALKPTETKSGMLGFDFSPTLYKMTWQFMDTFCNNKIRFYDTIRHHTLLSGHGHKAYKNVEGFGQFRHHWYEFQGIAPNGYYHYDNIIYAKLDSCTEGTKLFFKTLSVSPVVDVSGDIAIYPNPVSDHITVQHNKRYQIENYTITDVKGRVYAKGKYAPVVPVGFLPKGIYLISLTTEKGQVYRKFLKE